MNFTQRDIAIIVAMAICVIFMTFTFNALGMTNENVKENDIPTFNATADNFDMVGDFPDNPGTPSTFTLTWDERLGGDSNNQIWLSGNTDSGVELVLLNNGNTSEPEPHLLVNNWTSGSVTQSEFYYTNEGDYHVVNNHSYELYTEWQDTRNINESNMQFDIYVNVRSQPSGNLGFIKRIPLLGGVVSAGETVASVVGYIGIILWWFSATLLEIVINLILMLYNTIAFFVAMMHWLLIAYSAIISGVSSWVSVIVAIPGILLGLEFTKLILIGIKLLPTT